MPIELAGISNENEFYSEHYLTTVFEGDIEETFATWRAEEKEGLPSPRQGLEKVAKAWGRLHADYIVERSDLKRLLIAREFAHGFLEALGYDRRSELLLDAEDKLIPVLTRRSVGGDDQVWVVEVPSPVGEDFETDPLQVKFRCEQFENIETAQDITRRRKDMAEIAVTRGVFGLETPPRFVVLLSMSQAVLIDRRKWPDSRLLRFRFSEIFGRSEGTTLGVTAALLHSKSLAPGSGTPLVDRIDEESHRHAFGVSQDLKFALREAIEILGNEAVELIVEKRRANKEGVFSGDGMLDAGKLTTECLRYMYRLLFLFFIEARPELGFAPMKAKAYRTGYSLEGLRELELVPLETDEDRNGHYISDTLDALFALVFHGTPAAGNAGEAFNFHAVRARLFDPDAVSTYLGSLRFRNEPMQAVIRLLSLSKGDRNRPRGRISYSQLGISQLGAVYESLLSFSGFFATEDLIELKPAGKSPPGPLEAAYFAPNSRAGDFVQAADWKDGEIVYEGNLPKVHPRGSFIYRLAGRNRENSASYYTPEPLARVLVKYALKDLLAGKSADDILSLRVVEPAMGSAAFLVEVVNQLADRYLELKQAEVKKKIPHESFTYERQKVRAFLADRNVFGVDLNPIAVELGQVSLWLNCLHAGGFAPWFEDQVHTGNSLVGARRAVFPAASLTRRKEDERWYRQRPREIGWSGEPRTSQEVWHFLLPDPGMSAYDMKILAPLASRNDLETLTKWRREFVQPLGQDEVATVVRLSEAVDLLFIEVADRLHEMRSEVNDEISIWPSSTGENERHVDFQEKIRRLAKFHGDGVRNSVPWRRLRAAMDAWCSLWFWPVDKADLLPSRATFLQGLDLVLTQGINNQGVTTRAFATGSPQGRLFETVDVPAAKGTNALFRSEERVVEIRKDDLFGDVDVEKLIAASPWMPTAMQVAERRRFMHFDLEFADVMRERGGFDLVIGNPPWLKPAWTDANVLSEIEPAFAVREVSAAEVEKRKPSLLSDASARAAYLEDYVEIGGLQAFISSLTCYPFLAQGQPNLYKCFMDLAFRVTARDGYAALIHQDNHLLDPDGGLLRRTWYRRIRRHYHFTNAITGRMFAEVSHRKTFSLNVYGGLEQEIGFDHAASLLLPNMVDDSYEHDGIGTVPSMKRPEGGWDTRGHRKRIVRVDLETLKSFAAVVEDANTPADTTRFLFPFSTETLNIFNGLSSGNISFTDGTCEFQMRRLWDESTATKRDKILEPKVCFPPFPADMVLTGSLLYVGNPFYKCPDASGRKENEIDLSSIGDAYIPRNYYKRIVEKEQYNKGITNLKWDTSQLHTSNYRIAFRRMMSSPTERTLIGALIPPGVAHVHTVESLAFSDEAKLVDAYPLWISLPFDFLVKTTGLTDLLESSLRFFPWAEVSDTAKHRALRLACLTQPYADIWNRHHALLDVMPWSSSDIRLDVEGPHSGSPIGNWETSVGLRSDFGRRMALVEIDVIVAQALGLTLDQLIEMYRTQFHVLDENERGTWYDRNGRIVWTCSKGLSGVGWRKNDGKKPSGREWLENYADMPEGAQLDCELVVDFLPGGPTKTHRSYPAPFITCDREADYRRAWAFFAAHEQRKAA
ncbi:hypothetical protein [Methylobacterium sp. Leaf91]|uniref:hypothetical protein n=1 Tax=Methylobacterium sp. Leaf91 TaxID=1736247 RepID=UPI0006F60D2D|nr:hypothetical protein [Methylobacterium sp. Leaf91]KQP00290.1 hypothetical protein ASF32_13710 [Methylobacterium sp. Leaf91]